MIFRDYVKLLSRVNIKYYKRTGKYLHKKQTWGCEGIIKMQVAQDTYMVRKSKPKWQPFVQQ